MVNKTAARLSASRDPALLAVQAAIPHTPQAGSSQKGAIIAPNMIKPKTSDVTMLRRIYIILALYLKKNLYCFADESGTNS